MKRQRLNTYGRARHGVFINGELRTSTAYQCLTASQRLILIDMLAKYNQKSMGDTVIIKDTGFTFTFHDCAEPVDILTFRKARAAIVENGFFELGENVKRIMPGAMNVYLPSTKWMHYEPTPSEVDTLAKAAKRKRDTLTRNTQRKNDFIQRKRGRGDAE